MNYREHSPSTMNVVKHKDGTYSLTNLNPADMRDLVDAYAAKEYEAFANASKPEPHWWNEGMTVKTHDHKEYFSSMGDYYRATRLKVEAKFKRY